TEPNLLGPADAPVRIVEYGDFGCPSCRAWHNSGIREQLVAAYGDQIAFEFRHFPVITAQSPKAAEAGQCAAEQGAFWAYHDYIYEATPQGALGTRDLKDYAAAIGLDQPSFDTCLDSGKYRSFVAQQAQLARQDGARGTPSFFINGAPASFSFQGMSAAIEQIIAN
ncbi:MAG: DsbA family protein, partial [Anaerolineae bacterium]